MIITRTPLRVSFLGGGTDYPQYFERHGGMTIGGSIDKYVLVTVHPTEQFSEYRLRIHYSQVESVRHIDEIRHPSARECLRFLDIEGGIEIHYVSSLPARSGLGSSSAATVGLLLALHAHRGEVVSREQLAAEAVHVEQRLIKERVGVQDQYTCAVGGLLHLEMPTDGHVHVRPLTIKPQRLHELEQNLMLLYCGNQRFAHDVLDEQILRTQTGENTASLNELKSLVRRGIEVLASDAPLREFGGLLHEAWLHKRRLSSKVSNQRIDDIYRKAMHHGAVGGKLLGAGSGGFVLLYVEPHDRERVLTALPDVNEVRFGFEHSGSTVLFYEP